MILRTFIAKHQNESIEVVDSRQIICLDGEDSWVKADFFTGSWMDATVEDAGCAILLQESVSVHDETGELVYYQVERPPTIEELQDELAKRFMASLQVPVALLPAQSSPGKHMNSQE